MSARSLRRVVAWALACVAPVVFGKELPPAPDRLYGPLFVDVQRGAVFPDQKTFVDCVPKSSPDKIVAAYAAAKRAQGAALDLKAFVEAHFLLPTAQRIEVPAGQPIEEHLATLWKLLRRDPAAQVQGGSLLRLPHPYIVPGGRFREVYYWDSYFTLLGLRESGDEAMIESMIDNFAYLIGHYGWIPNGNRTYFLSRSQPPFFAAMVELLAEKKGPGVYVKYLPALQAELDYWMDRTAPTHHVVTLPDGAVLNRYYDQLDTPRPEAFAKEEAVSRKSSADPKALYRNLRAACESGWDFSSRWFGDGRALETIRTTRLVPVDLNCLLYRLELTLARAYQENGDTRLGAELATAARHRQEAILTHCWSTENRFFCDYDLDTQKPSPALTLAGVLPLFVQIATPAQAASARATIQEKFLRPGGVVTTLVRSGQQWDAPNGWAPLQWLTIRGLENYGEHALAAEIAHRWLTLNREVYQRTGKMMEKYNVEDTSLAAGGGEYPSQDGFGWTNGVYLKLAHAFPDEPAVK